MVAKSKPMMSLVSKIANRSPTLDCGASYSPGTLVPALARDVKGVNENTASSFSSVASE